MKWAVAAVRFACEIASVVAVVWWLWPWLGLLTGVALCAVWGAWVAPKAKRQLPDPWRLELELAIFALATVAFFEVGQVAVAIVFAVAALSTALLSRRLPAV